MAKRIFDLLFSLVALLIFLPILFIIAVLIKLDSEGPVFFFQSRVGKNGNDFKLVKFRTMKVKQENSSLITVGKKDVRVTKVGYFLRKYKLDELPQFINILKGEMTFVGPRPEVRKYVDLYTEEQRFVLSVKPGLTDPASIQFSNESELLATSKDPENFYIQEIIPEKIKLSVNYISKQTLITDITLILKTIFKILR